MDKRFQAFMALPQAARDTQLSPSKFAKDAPAALSTMVAQTHAALSNPLIRVVQDIRYGARERQLLDVFCPAQPAPHPMPCLVFVHGGFWQEGDKSVSGFAAKTFTEMGWAWASVGYTLTPDVSLTEIVAEIYDAIAFLRHIAPANGIDPEGLVIAGHSAGAHLAAALMADVLERGGEAPVSGAVLISGVYDLAPIASSYVNDLARITPDEVMRLSPVRSRPVHCVPTHVLVGGDEPEAFLNHTHVLHRSWKGELQDFTRQVAVGRDHFDVLNELTDPSSYTVRAISKMAVAPVQDH